MRYYDLHRRDFFATITALLAARGSSTGAAAKPFVHFTDIGHTAGLVNPVTYGGIERKKYIVETNGCGIAFFDYDHDGWLDIFVPGGSRLEGAPPATSNRLYRNNRNGTFTDVTRKAGLERVCWSCGVTIGDFNNDGFDDLFVSCWGQNILYRNNGDGTFTDVTRQAGLLHPEPVWGAGCTFIDFDRDGLLDLFVSTYLKFQLEAMPLPGEGQNCNWKGIPVNCGPRGLEFGRNYLYRNNGDGTFTDVSQSSGIAKVEGRYGMTAVAADFDADGWPDIFVACDSTPSILYRNNRDGTFTDIAMEAGVAYNDDGREQAGMGVALGDVTNAGVIDIFKTHFADDTPILYRGSGKGRFEDSTNRSGMNMLTRYVGWGTGLCDFDNDGNLDLFFVNGNVYPEVEKILKEYPYKNPRVLLHNLGGGKFEDASEAGGPGVTEPHSSRGCAFGDFDNDGNIDILIMNMNEPPSLLRNDLANGNHWLTLKLIGTRSNRTALGATVIARAGGWQQRQQVLGQSSFYSQNDLRLHFGLGKFTQVDEIEILWPLGLREIYRNVKADQILTLREGAAAASAS